MRKILNQIIQQYDEYKKISECLPKNKLAAATGLTNVHKVNVLSALSSQLNKKIFVLTGDEQESQQLANNFASLGMKAFVYPLRDFNFRLVNGRSREYEHQRLMVLSAIAKNDYDVIISTVDAASQYTMPETVLKKSSMPIQSGGTMDVQTLIDFLVSAGYEKCDTVEGGGQFAVRGGIVDLFMPDEKMPVRIEFFGDEIDTINYFDVFTQRRTDYIEKIHITVSTEIIVNDKSALAAEIRKKSSALRGKNSGAAKAILEQEAEFLENGNTPGSIDKFISMVYKKTTLFDYLTQDRVFIAVSEHTRVKERMNGFLWQFGEDMKSLAEEGVLCRGFENYSINYDNIIDIFRKRGVLYLDNFTSGSYDTPLSEMVSFSVKNLSLWGGSTKLLTEDIEPYIRAKYTTVILAGTERASDSLRGELIEKGYNVSESKNVDCLNEKIYVLPGALSSGIEYPQKKFALISQGHIRTISKRKSGYRNKSKQIFSLAELSIGDYVVHETYGIGKFDGIHQLDVRGIIKDYIKILYDKGEMIYVPVTSLDLVTKYIGPKEDGAVKLSRLSSGDWTKAKAKVRKATKDIAEDLIKLYAERMKTQGYAFGADGEWQRDFEAKFEYEETEDQLRCIDEIKGDMEKSVPMERLLCGDVGFGKTEVALRAAFKCVSESKQCILLAPTTILAWQHYQTVLRRFEGFPVNIELLSRFRSTKQQHEILKKLKTGEIDFIIGTHKLIQKNVEFRDPGLVIIDEEQRFGVAQKEHFKQKFKNVDILSLSATPIPRTLNMAMSGLRDMSVIEEAPLDRKPVQTYVLAHDSTVITEAIRRELRRGGQVFYLYNKIDTITHAAARIKKDVPEANIGIAHGRMNEQELSEIWRQMLEEEINVLVCTTIIETGVDLPNANTLIIENADCMGLSQLHQIRGRVGRSSRRAYAYFTFNPQKELSDIATKRLTAIREFTEFGSGFKIAMRDLELRVAGSILGSDQHGHIEDVGYDMYIRMLNEAIAETKGEPLPKRLSECVIDLKISAYIPDTYIEHLNHRIDAYRRIADIRNREDASDVIDELLDRYGDLPQTVMRLIDVMLVKNMASAEKFYEIKQCEQELRFFTNDMDSDEVIQFIKNTKGNARIVMNKTKPFIGVPMTDGATVLDMLKKLL